MTEQKLNQLFESARNAQIETSQEEVTRWLATAAVAAVSAGAAATGFKLLLTKNALAMIIGTLGVAGIAIVSTAVFSGSSPEPVAENQNVVTYLDSNEKQIDSETAFYAVNIPVNENASEDERVDANEYPVIIENQQPQIGNKTVRFEFPVTPMIPVTGMGTAPLRTIVYKDTAR